MDFLNRTASYGLMIGEPAARGRGYGTEAPILMLDYAFMALGLHSLYLSCYEFNLAGQRAYEKAGFKMIGRRRQCRWMGGRLWDELLMDCLATEFESPYLGQVFVSDPARIPDR
ncbi:MAG: GNAT family N-acetyltransferase [Chloroflexota bacterium]|nr:GNAT family N-acetyltransferase [Chloroflexota bacterium]